MKFIVAILMIPAAIASLAYRSLLVDYAWEWYATKAFGIASPGWAVILGFSLMWTLAFMRKHHDERKPTALLADLVITNQIAATLSFVILWALSGFV